ncbi:MAG: hypothetical protein R3B93_25440 [Bacteroidia bacterium]
MWEAEAFIPGTNLVLNNICRVPPHADGTPAGDYAPVRTWVLPRLHEVIDGRISYQVNKKVRIFSENSHEPGRPESSFQP